MLSLNSKHQARLAQSVEHETLNLRVVGSSPTLGERYLLISNFRFGTAHLILVGVKLNIK